MRIQTALAAALVAAPCLSHAVVYQFNASLNSANEVNSTSAETATGIASLSYDDKGTLSLTDDTYGFTMFVAGLSGAATAFHIHGAASTAENAPVRVSLDAAPFLSLNSGGNLLVGGSGI
ncbi:MAG TPA: CHRD domain-containing protein, partial [Roseateles sp.]|nr:CHRD domain-containing protein [Roseateles sp.]